MDQSLRSFVLAFVFFLSLSSCAHAQAVPSGTDTSIVTVRLWVAPDASVPKIAIVKGCRYWEPLGVRCFEVSRPEHANIRVRFVRGACVSRKKAREKGIPVEDAFPLRPECRVRAEADRRSDNVIIGLAHDTGDVEIFIGCIQETWPDTVDARNVFATTHLVPIVAHEIGHALGMDHVPAACDDPCIKYAMDANGTKVCGVGVMNHQVDESLVLGLPDTQAFNLRDRRRP